MKLFCGKDLILKKCFKCWERILVIAYWDFELEYYIFLRDEAVCDQCYDKFEKNKIGWILRLNDYEWLKGLLTTPLGKRT